jgi:hypothetical protein
MESHRTKSPITPLCEGQNKALHQTKRGVEGTLRRP